MTSGKPNETAEEFAPGTLEEFQDRFGKLEDRFEQAVHPDLERSDMPTAEHPKMVEAREQSQAEQNTVDRSDYLNDQTSKPDFQDAATNSKIEPSQGQGSLQVQKDAPEQNMPPPENTKPVDRQRHNNEMRTDDKASQETMADEYYAKLDDQLKAEAQDQRYEGQEQTYGNDYDQSR